MKGTERFIIFLIIEVGMLCIAAISACFGEQISVGILLPLNGKMAIIGDIEKKAFEMAAEELQNSDSFSQPRIVLYFRDTMGQPEVARQAALSLITEDGVSLITGGCSSNATFAAMQVAEEHSLPFLITTASADKLTEMNMKYVYRLCSPASEYTKPFLALLSKFRGSKRGCILRENSRYGRHETKPIVRVCRKARVLVTDIITYPAQAVSDEATYFQKLQLIRPDILFVLARGSEPVRILALVQVLDKIPRLIFCKGDAFLKTDTYIEAQSALGNIYTTAPWHPAVTYMGAQEFYQRFRERYGIEPDYHAAQAYASLQVIAHAVSQALSPDPEGIREALDQSELMTVLGLVRFQSYGDKERQNRPPMVLLRWTGENLLPVSY